MLIENWYKEINDKVNKIKIWWDKNIFSYFNLHDKQ